MKRVLPLLAAVFLATGAAAQTPPATPDDEVVTTQQKPVEAPPPSPAPVPAPAAKPAAPAVKPGAAPAAPAPSGAVLTSQPIPSQPDTPEPPKGASWRLMGADNRALVLADANSLVKVGDESHIWVTMIYSATQNGGGVAYEMSQTRQVFDCKKRVWRIVQIRLLDGAGKAVYAAPPPKADTGRPVGAGTGEAQLMAAACIPSTLGTSEPQPNLQVARDAYLEIVRDRVTSQTQAAKP